MCGDHIVAEYESTGGVCRSCPWSAEKGKKTCSRSRLRIWFRETDLTVPSRVSLLILHTQPESGAYSRDCSRCPRQRPYIFTTTYHRVSPRFIVSRNCVPIAFTTESPLAQGQYSPQSSSSNGCRLCITMDQLLLCASLFPHPPTKY